MRPADWTVLIDDMATQRVRTCTLCGSQLDQLSLESWSNGAVVAAVVLCARCRERDAQRTAVQALLAHRYREPKEERRERVAVDASPP